MPILELKGVSLAFGGLKVVDRLDLHVDEGEIVSVIGPNGAGKTTLFNLITGIYRPDEGEIMLDGESIVGLQPHQISRRGVSRTFQTLRLFLNMSVKENVMAAAYGHTRAGVFRSMLRTPGMRREERAIEQLAEERLAFFGKRLMGYRWDQPAYSLSYANRRRLEIARATATSPRLLLLDEPAAGMNPTDSPSGALRRRRAAPSRAPRSPAPRAACRACAASSGRRRHACGRTRPPSRSPSPTCSRRGAASGTSARRRDD